MRSKWLNWKQVFRPTERPMRTNERRNRMGQIMWLQQRVKISIPFKWLRNLLLVSGQVEPCVMTPGFFLGSKLLYTTNEHHLYRKNKYNANSDVCFWDCQNCNARVKTKGNPKMADPIVCVFAESYNGHEHPTQEVKKQKLAKKTGEKNWRLDFIIS